MKSNITRFFAVVLVGLAITACRSGIVYNVIESPLMVDSGATVEQVGTAIRRAGASLGWQMKKVRDGKIMGTLILRTHRAVVDIKYDTENFSITYADSTNLNYNGTNIHSNYNGWVQNLEHAIKSQVSSM
ncbi:MAG: hypothetical protein JKY92_05420 [Magnetovibrio sp.]|nr:hypothetical protein [Magnetovibrio sp.]